MFNEYRKLLKHIDSIENNEHYVEPLHPDVTMIYPMNSWTFWYRNAMTLQSNFQWEESLTKIVTVRDVVHLWK